MSTYDEKTSWWSKHNENVAIALTICVIVAAFTFLMAWIASLPDPPFKPRPYLADVVTLTDGSTHNCSRTDFDSDSNGWNCRNTDGDKIAWWPRDQVKTIQTKTFYTHQVKKKKWTQPTR